MGRQNSLGTVAILSSYTCSIGLSPAAGEWDGVHGERTRNSEDRLFDAVEFGFCLPQPDQKYRANYRV